jgi:hypothetical protein
LKVLRLTRPPSPAWIPPDREEKDFSTDAPREPASAVYITRHSIPE